MFCCLSVIVIADNLILPVDNNDDDYYYNNVIPGVVTGTSLLSGMKNNFLFPPVTETIYAIINTSSLNSSMIISSTTLHFYIDSFTVSGRPRPSKEYYVNMNNYSSQSTIGTYLHTVNGWYTHSLSMSNINSLNENGDTMFIIGVTDPGASKMRSMEVRAKEHAPRGYEAYLNVTYTITSSTCYCGGFYCEGDGDFIVTATDNVVCNESIIPINGKIIVHSSGRLDFPTSGGAAT